MKMPYKKNSKTTKNILFVHFGKDWVRGSERCLLDLISHIDRSQFTPFVWCNSPAFAKEIEALGVQCTCSPLTVLFGWDKPYFDLLQYIKQVRQGLKLVSQYNIDILHANSGAPNQWLFPVSKLLKTPLITQLHSPYIFRDRLTLGLHFNNRIIGVSKATLAGFTEDGIAHGHCRVIYNGLDLKKHEDAPILPLREYLSLPENKFLIATIGSLIKRKGVDDVIEAVKISVDNGVDVHLLVIGDGDELNNLRKAADLHKIQEHIHFIGASTKVPSLLKGGVDAVISGAREEAFGLVLAEAGLARLPVIATHVNGIPEVIENTKTGLLVPPNCPHSLFIAIKKLYQNPALRRQMGEAGYARVKEKFTITKNVALFSSLYNETLLEHSKVKNYRSISLSRITQQMFFRFTQRLARLR